MNKKNLPKILTFYLIKKYNFSLIVFFFIFFFFSILITIVDQLIFLRDHETSNYTLKAIYLSILKSSSSVFDMLPFIFLSGSILFFVRLKSSNEVSPIKLSGVSNIFLIFVPSIYSFLIGIFIIIFLTPLSSEAMKLYETNRQKYSNNENLIIFSENGIWLKENKIDKKYIIRTDTTTNEDFNKLSNISIFVFSNENKLLERIVAKEVEINVKSWVLKNVYVLSGDKNQKLNSYLFKTSIDMEKLKKFYLETYAFSVWNILSELKKINDRGYLGQDLIVKFNKFISLPFLLVLMVILSTIFTIQTNKKNSNFFYIFFGISTGILIYFLNDASIAIGKTGKIPIILSVWFPIIIITLVCMLSIKKNV